jgi:hypothetical protein
MSEDSPSVRTSLIILSVVLIAGCQHVESYSRDVEINGFSDTNYAKLDGRLGTPVCILGQLTIDKVHRAVYFPLQTNKDSDVITLGLSRIISGLTYDDARRNAMAHGKRYRVCGTLRDATPFRRCDNNRCKWYRLENSHLRS